MTSIKTKIHDSLNIRERGGKLSRAINQVSLYLIAANVIAVILETEDSIYMNFNSFFVVFEIVSVIIFSIEYVLRIWSCVADEKYSGSVKGRIRFAISPMALVDLFAILPFYLPMLIPMDLRFLRALRLFRIFRVLKIGRYSKAVQILARVFMAKKEELLITIVAVSVLLIISSSLMYYLERDAQPDAFSSIPAALWWGIITLSTVGYGDVYPVTAFGKRLGMMVAISGIGMFALPAGILGSGFVEYVQSKKKSSQTCPHCGRRIDIDIM